MIDLIELYRDHSIPYKTEGHKHCRPGWVQARCPFCTGNPGWHLGYSLEDGYFRCWRCGWHPVTDTLAALLHVTKQEARRIAREYRRRGPSTGTFRHRQPVKRVRRKSLRLPYGTSPLLPHHQRYLQKRGFDPDLLAKRWGLLSTGPVSKLDGVNYNHRILIPIHWEGRMVSFQTRDTTGKATVKYKACPKSRELIHHRTILYGRWDRCLEERWVVVVEGVFDVWRVDEAGLPVVATFGINYNTQQLRLLAQLGRVIIMYDPDPQARAQAHKLRADLRLSGVKSDIVVLEKDPGDTSTREIVRNVL